MYKRIVTVILVTTATTGIPQIAGAGIRVDFDRDNNTYNWLTSYSHTAGRGPNSIRSYFDGRSNLIKGSFDRWQESASAGFDSEVSLRNRIKFISSGEYTVNGLDRRRVKTSELAMGFSLRPARSIELRPMIRADNKKRSELETQLDEKGLGYGIEGPQRLGAARWQEQVHAGRRRLPRLQELLEGVQGGSAVTLTSTEPAHE